MAGRRPDANSAAWHEVWCIECINKLFNEPSFNSYCDCSDSAQSQANKWLGIDVISRHCRGLAAAKKALNFEIMNSKIDEVCSDAVAEHRISLKMQIQLYKFSIAAWLSGEENCSVIHDRTNDKRDNLSTKVLGVNFGKYDLFAEIDPNPDSKPCHPPPLNLIGRDDVGAPLQKPLIGPAVVHNY